MRFEFQEVASLPCLAWCARIEVGATSVVIHHGTSVETRAGWFAEGPWNGPFESGGFLDASMFCGTGGVADDGRVRFVSSSDRISPFFSIIKDGSLYISNSPVFAMAAAGEEPDYIYPFYAYDEVAIWREGLHSQSGNLRLGSGNKLRLHFSTIMSIDESGATAFEPHPLCTAPTDYSSYRSLLADAIAGIIRNGGDPARKIALKPVAAISRGYDSTAMAALAAQAGCHDAFTFTDSRRPRPDSDSGAGIAPILGLACSVYDRWDYLNLDGMPEAEFGIIPLAAPIPVAAAEESLRNRVLISGIGGDRIWDPQWAFWASDFASTCSMYCHGVGHMEHRLRIGLSVAAPPYVGMRHNRAIHAISVSQEMRPWAIGGEYDRPIPRRIAEEAGVPREQFGQVEWATGSTRFSLEKSMSPRAREHYREFRDRRHAGIPRLRRLYWRVLVGLRHRIWRMVSRRRLVASTLAQRRLPFVLNIPPLVMNWDRMFTFQWTFDILRDRYRLPDRPNIGASNNGA